MLEGTLKEMRGPIPDVRGTTAVQSLALSNISLLAVGQRGLLASGEGLWLTLDRCTSSLVMRTPGLWLLYILATSFVTFVDCTDLGTGLYGDGASHHQLPNSG